MIFDSIDNRESYKDIPRIYRALCWLAQRQSSGPALTEREEIEPGMFASPVIFETKPEAECLFEAHRRFTDLHFIAGGTETIAVQSLPQLTEKIPYDEEKDIAFYEGRAAARCRLSPGYFLVCAPHDAHCCSIMEDAPQGVEKIMVKLAE